MTIDASAAVSLLTGVGSAINESSEYENYFNRTCVPIGNHLFMERLRSYIIAAAIISISVGVGTAMNESSENMRTTSIACVLQSAIILSSRDGGHQFLLKAEAIISHFPNNTFSQ